MRIGAPRASRFTHRPSFKARSSSRRPSTARRLRPPAWIICAGIWQCFLLNLNNGENIMSTATLKVQSSRDEADIRGLIESVHNAHHNKDAAAIAAPYAQSAAIYNL